MKSGEKLYVQTNVDHFDEERASLRHQTNSSFVKKVIKTLRNNQLSLFTCFGVFLGLGLGAGARFFTISDNAGSWIAMPGTIYLRLLHLTILPMIAARVLLVTATLDPKEHGIIGIVAFSLMLVCNMLASTLGILLTMLIKPGSRQSLAKLNSTGLSALAGERSTSDIFTDLAYNLFPDNILGIGIYTSESKHINISRTYDHVVHYEYKQQQGNIPGINMLGLLFSATVIGLAANKVGEKSLRLLEFFDSTALIIEQVIKWILKLTPIGACFMIAGAVVSIKTDLKQTMIELVLFITSFILGLFVQAVIFFLLVFIVAKKNPFKYVFVHGLNAYLLTLATGMPLVSIPHMYQACDKSDISTKISRFIIPLATVVKSDGSGLYLSAAVAFACQMTGMNSWSNLGLGGLLTFLLICAAPQVPSACLLMLITILTTLDVPYLSVVSLLFAIDWFCDRFRSGNNTISTLVCTLITDYVARRKKHGFYSHNEENSRIFHVDDIIAVGLESENETVSFQLEISDVA